MKRCEYCGAKIHKNVSKCPYCEHFNYEGAEKEYMDKMENIHNNLKNVKNEVENVYEEQLEINIKKETRKERKDILKVFLIITFFLIGFCSLCGLTVESDVNSRKTKDEQLYKEDDARKQKYYPSLNKLLKEKDYDNLYKYYKEHEKEDGFYMAILDHKHFDFLQAMLVYYELPEDIEIPTDKKEYIRFLQYNYDYECYIRDYLDAYWEIAQYQDIDDDHEEKYLEMVNFILNKIYENGLTEEEEAYYIEFLKGDREKSTYDLADIILERKLKEANEM